MTGLGVFGVNGKQYVAEASACVAVSSPTSGALPPNVDSRSINPHCLSSGLVLEWKLLLDFIDVLLSLHSLTQKSNGVAALVACAMLFAASTRCCKYW